MCAMCIATTMQAQSNVHSTRAANAPEGKILTMEETILSRDLAPKDLRCRWIDEDHIGIFQDGKWMSLDTETWKSSEYSSKKPRPYGFTKKQALMLMPKDGEAIVIADSDDKNISFGQSVSRNEFGISGGIFMSPDSTKVAFYRKDETLVTSFPLLDITTRTGSLKEIKYPMAGMNSERVSLGIYDIATGNTIYVKTDDFADDRYLTNITWSPDGTRIFISVLDRSQKHMKLNMYEAADGSFIGTILTEDNEKYVEPLDPLYFIKNAGDAFLYRTANRDGYRNLYLCDTHGNIRRLTCTDADVEYIGNDGRYVYYTSAEVSPVENHLFRIEIKSLKKGVAKATFGKPERLTKAEGWHNIAMNKSCTNIRTLTIH